MAKLDEQGNLTLSQAEVMQLRGLTYQYGQEVGFKGTDDPATSLLMKQIRCMLPIPEEED